MSVQKLKTDGRCGGHPQGALWAGLGAGSDVPTRGGPTEAHAVRTGPAARLLWAPRTRARVRVCVSATLVKTRRLDMAAAEQEGEGKSRWSRGGRSTVTPAAGGREHRPQHGAPGSLRPTPGHLAHAARCGGGARRALPPPGPRHFISCLLPLR